MPADLPCTASSGPSPDTSHVLTLATALYERDAYTDAHCDRVGRLTRMLAQRIGVAGDALDHLGLAARFHDIGKIGIPDSVLHHPGRLSEEQMALMRTHPARGQRLFLATGRADAVAVAQIIRHHHEAWDGNGYPDGLRHGQIPLASRILAVVDGFDALVTQRPYRPAMPLDAAMAILANEAGSRLDPDVQAEFARMARAPGFQADCA